MFAFTEDLMAAGGVTARTLDTWIKAGVLPRPELVAPGGPGGHVNRYPAWAVERARFIGLKRRAGYTLAEILTMLPEQGSAAGGETNSSGPKKSTRRR
ncbi:MerR family transcriptional regulator [Nannocystis sp. ILAH1]|uniref:helix-turn-helix domain-containing protein n=1 Tax=Nannocystis sp. ILAH1 TaxID=2996789 RepID=UPI00226E6BB7|nr:MerR family transcriptional regulator [Nannocystis sp. ILAH1]MCY0994698.1 MerR family transcriptional regulator [Nannocystis sp. ILAH1]